MSNWFDSTFNPTTWFDSDNKWNELILGKEPGIEQTSAASKILPETYAAIKKLLGLADTMPKAADVRGSYEQNLTDLLKRVTGGIEGSLASNRDYSMGAVKDIFASILPQISGAVDPALAGIKTGYADASKGVTSLFEGLKPYATREASAAFDVLSQKGFGKSGAAKEMAEETYMNTLYNPMFTTLAGLKTKEAGDISSLFSTTAGKTQDLLGVESSALSSILKSTYSDPMTTLAQAPAQLFDYMSKMYDPFMDTNNMIKLLTSVISGTAGITGDTVVTPGSQGLLSNLIGGMSQGAGAGWMKAMMA